MFRRNNSQSPTAHADALGCWAARFPMWRQAPTGQRCSEAQYCEFETKILETTQKCLIIYAKRIPGFQLSVEMADCGQFLKSRVDKV